jgi:hypothetical protein
VNSIYFFTIFHHDNQENIWDTFYKQNTNTFFIFYGLTIFLPGEALGPVESSSTGEISSVSDEDVPEKDPDLEPVSGGDLSDE